MCKEIIVATTKSSGNNNIVIPTPIAVLGSIILAYLKGQ